MKKLIIFNLLILSSILYGQEDQYMSIKGNITGIDLVAFTFLATPMENGKIKGNFRFYHYEVLDTNTDSTYSFKAKFRDDYMYLILIEDMTKDFNQQGDRIVINTDNPYDIELDINYKMNRDYSIDYMIGESNNSKGYFIKTEKLEK